MTFNHSTVLMLSSAALLSALSTSVWAAEEATESDAEVPAVAAQPEAAPAPNGPAKPSGESVRAPNSVNVEGLGAGLIYSFNYERLVMEDLGVRVGLSYMSVSASATSSNGTSSASASFMTFPIEVSYLGVGSKHHMLEAGGGFSLLYASGSASGTGYSASGSGLGVLPNLLLGYRLHPVDGAGFQFRVGMMVFVGKGLGYDATDPDKIGFFAWPYLSLGASF